MISLAVVWCHPPRDWCSTAICKLSWKSILCQHQQQSWSLPISPPPTHATDTNTWRNRFLLVLELITLQAGCKPWCEKLSDILFAKREILYHRINLHFLFLLFFVPTRLLILQILLSICFRQDPRTNIIKMIWIYLQ